MPNTITTTGTNPDTSTKSLPGELPSAWVARHSLALEDATLSGNTLSTTWTSANGKQSIDTTRHTGESDVDFILRHIQEYLMAMIDEPPIP